MKISCISASQVPSDTANSIQAMKACQALAQLGHEVHLLVPGGASHPWERLAAHYGLKTPFTVEWLPARARLRRYDFALTAVRKARRLGAEAVYVWPLQAAVLGLLWNLPVLLELHGEPEGLFGPTLFRLFLTLPGARRMLPITRALAVSLGRTYGGALKPDEVVIAPNGVDLDRYQDLPIPPDARRLLGLPEGITAGYTGHLYPGRGIDLLAELAQRNPQVHFLWVGGREQDVTRWRDRLASAGVTNVSLVGFVDNLHVPLYQAAAEILLMPYETVITGSSGGDSAAYCSPMKMFEYLACGRAILSSDLPVIHEVLDETTARFCPPENVPAWDQALKALLSQPDLRAEMGHNARRRAEEYTWLARARQCLAGFAG